MTRSRRRKLMREAARRSSIIRTGIPVASALLASMPAVYAQEPPAGGGLAEVVVTAQKVTENLQNVPLSIQALGNEKLEQLHIVNIDDYVKYLPGVTTVKGLGQGGTGIGTTHMYMRGVVSGQDGNHSASQPSVGTYFDEQPVTTIAGTNTTTGLAAAGIVKGVRTFPTSGLTLNNVDSLNDQYNTASTEGGRITGQLNLGGNWTVSPLFMGQTMSSNGFFGYDPGVGDLQLVHSGPEGDKDSFTQSALTIEGKVSDFDMVYAGGWLVRNQHAISDYSDYSFFYDKYYASGCNWVTQAGAQYIQSHPTAISDCYNGVSYPAGDFAMPQEFVITNGHYTKW